MTITETTEPQSTPAADSGRKVDSFGIRLNKQWHHVPLERTAFDAYRRQLSDEWSQVEGWTKSDGRKMDLMLGKIRSDLGKNAVKFAAFFFELGVPRGKELTDENIEPLMASLTFSIHTQSDLKTNVRLTPEVLFTAFCRRNDPDSAAYGYRSTDLEPPQFADLNLGRAVHLRRFYEGANPLHQMPPFFSETFIVSIGEHHDACGIMQFSTTNVTESRPFSKLFNGLANTATLFADGDDTVFNGDA